MHIAILSSGLGTTARGIESWARSLAESLHHEGEQVTLFHGGGEYACANVTLRYPKRDSRLIRAITRLALSPALSWSKGFTWRWGLTSRYALEQRFFTRAFSRWLRQQDAHSLPDIIHTQDYVVVRQLTRHWPLATGHSSIIFGNVTDEPPPALAGLPYLQHVSQPDYAAALACPALSPSTPTPTHPHTHTLPLHFLVPNFVDTTRFTPCTPKQRAAHRRKYGIPENAFVIGNVSALQRHHKRLDALIDEIASLSSLSAPLRLCARSSFHLLLAGATTPDTPFIERYAQERLPRACRGVTILKDQPFNAMPAIYQSMDLYVHPAPEEVFGICLLESMASGVPVIAHHSPRLQYVVGQGGWLTDVMRAGFLGEMWAQVRAELVESSERSRPHVAQHFSWAAVYPAYMAMYREAAK